MPSLITSNFRIKNSKSFMDSFSNENIYVAIGKVDPWTDDNNPDIPIDTVNQTTYTHWNSFIAAKKLQTINSINGIKRYDWVSGETWDRYDPNNSLLYRNLRFYVLVNDNDTYKVYKCLNNNGSTPSTIKPVSTSASAFTTADGYVWKYMYTIQPNNVTLFLTPNYMPVEPSPVLGTNVDSSGTGSLLPLPYNGHGFDNISELGAYYALCNVKFEYDESGLVDVNNNFRKISILVNPTLYGTSTVASGTIYSLAEVLSLSGASGTFPQDDIITGLTVNDYSIVIYHDVANSKLYTVPVSGTINTGNTITGTSSSASVSSITRPSFNKYSGELIYVENRKPINRAEDQTESITFVFEF